MKKRFLTVLPLFILISGCNIKNDILKGKWQTAIEDQKNYQYNNQTKGGKEKNTLECDGKGNYDLRQKEEDLANANYTISKNKVTFYDESHQVLAICKLINNKELDCNEQSYYALRYKKIQ